MTCSLADVMCLTNDLRACMFASQCVSVCIYEYVQIQLLKQVCRIVSKIKERTMTTDYSSIGCVCVVSPATSYPCIAVIACTTG